MYLIITSYRRANRVCKVYNYKIIVIYLIIYYNIDYVKDRSKTFNDKCGDNHV